MTDVVQQIAQAYRDLATSEAGRVVLGDLALRFGYERRRLFDENPYTLARNAGQLEVLLHIRRMIEDPAGTPAQGDLHE